MFEKNENRRSIRRPQWKQRGIAQVEDEKRNGPSLADPGPSPDDLGVFKPYL